jgi:hypothetical protein
MNLQRRRLVKYLLNKNSKHISLFSALFGFKHLNFFMVGASKGGSDRGLSGPLRGLVRELCLGKQYRF